jgi:hypothetical protein
MGVGWLRATHSPMKRKEENYKGHGKQCIRAIPVENLLPEGFRSSGPMRGDKADEKCNVEQDQSEQSHRLHGIQFLCV